MEEVGGWGWNGLVSRWRQGGWVGGPLRYAVGWVGVRGSGWMQESSMRAIRGAYSAAVISLDAEKLQDKYPVHGTGFC